MFDSRGQEAAPFELLIAVIVMGFVLLAGINVMDILKKEECKGTLDNQMEQIKSAIENVASGAGQRDFSFSLPECYNRGQENGDQISKLQVVHINNQRVCGAVCPGARIECLILSFTTEDHHNQKCLRISTATQFPDSADQCNDFDPDADKFEARDLIQKPLESGQYLLIRKFQLSSQTPNICAYKKVV